MSKRNSLEWSADSNTRPFSHLTTGQQTILQIAPIVEEFNDGKWAIKDSLDWDQDQIYRLVNSSDYYQQVLIDFPGTGEHVTYSIDNADPNNPAVISDWGESSFTSTAEIVEAFKDCMCTIQVDTLETSNER